MNHSYLTAIIICKKGKLTEALKYHDIQNNETKIATFLKFASQKPGARYVNFYYKVKFNSQKGKNYAFRRYIE